MCEVTLTFRRSNMSNSRGSPSLKPYSYHLLAGKSGYIGSIFGIGLSAPLIGWAPASICIDMETTRQAPSGQKELLESAGGTEIGDLPMPKVSGSKARAVLTASAETALFLMKSRRFIDPLA